MKVTPIRLLNAHGVTNGIIATCSTSMNLTRNLNRSKRHLSINNHLGNGYKEAEDQTVANDKKIAPSITKTGGLGGNPGDRVHFWHAGRQDYLPGFIESVNPVYYQIIWDEIVAKPGQIIKSGFKTHVKKQNCIIYKEK